MKRFKMTAKPWDYRSATVEPVESPNGQWVDINDRLTEAETAVIEAALAQTGRPSPRLAMALNRLRTERVGQPPKPWSGYETPRSEASQKARDEIDEDRERGNRWQK